MTQPNAAERGLERLLFASRWLMAPMYLGLVIALGMLLIVFGREIFHYAPHVFEMQSEDVILVVLTLIDLTLAANLLVIVLFSGYENFVSKFDFDTGMDRPDWMGTVDFSGLKMKLIASIVAISAIDLLKWFMAIEDFSSPEEMNQKLYWLVVIHLTFVVSGLLMALMDYLTSRSPH
jgi:uncharacterized protein (TIGR00645 family)